MVRMTSAHGELLAVVVVAAAAPGENSVMLFGKKTTFLFLLPPLCKFDCGRVVARDVTVIDHTRLSSSRRMCTCVRACVLI